MKFRIEWFDQLGSTNTFMHEQLRQHPTRPTGIVIATRNQTAGRGRSARKWLSAPDTNLCFSLYVASSAEPLHLPSLTMAAALAVNDLLNRHHIPSAPKWPNDLLVGSNKICGILSERIETPDAKGIIIGIGLNINMTTEEAASIDRPATSMLIETGQAYRPDQILQELLPLLKQRIERWQNGYFQALRDEWTTKAGPIGKPITVHDGDLIKTGTLVGFGEYGELQLQTKHGIETIWSGDVT